MKEGDHFDQRNSMIAKSKVGSCCEFFLNVLECRGYVFGIKTVCVLRDFKAKKFYNFLIFSPTGIIISMVAFE